MYSSAFLGTIGDTLDLSVIKLANNHFDHFRPPNRVYTAHSCMVSCANVQKSSMYAHIIPLRLANPKLPWVLILIVL